MSHSIWAPTAEERLAIAIQRLMDPVPSTKGLGPSDRAQRLHAELERRIAIAKGMAQDVKDLVRGNQ